MIFRLAADLLRRPTAFCGFFELPEPPLSGALLRLLLLLLLLLFVLLLWRGAVAALAALLSWQRVVVLQRGVPVLLLLRLLAGRTVGRQLGVRRGAVWRRLPLLQATGAGGHSGRHAVSVRGAIGRGVVLPALCARGWGRDAHAKLLLRRMLVRLAVAAAGGRSGSALGRRRSRGLLRPLRCILRRMLPVGRILRLWGSVWRVLRWTRHGWLPVGGSLRRAVERCSRQPLLLLLSIGRHKLRCWLRLGGRRRLGMRIRPLPVRLLLLLLWCPVRRLLWRPVLLGRPCATPGCVGQTTKVYPEGAASAQRRHTSLFCTGLFPGDRPHHSMDSLQTKAWHWIVWRADPHLQEAPGPASGACQGTSSQSPISPSR